MAIIVTGAGKGIGRATLEHCAQLGADVVGVDLAGADDAATAVRAAGATAIGCTADVRSPADWTRVVARAHDAFGRVDGLANVAGVLFSGRDTMLGPDDEVWGETLDANLRGCWLGMRAVLPAMVERGAGRIVNVSSVAAQMGVGDPAYTASKGGLEALTRQAAVQYAPRGIRVNAVAPGAIDGGHGRAARNAEEQAARFAAIPARRAGRPLEVAAAIAYLLSDLADYVVGATLTIDGGLSAGLAPGGA